MEPPPPAHRDARLGIRLFERTTRTVKLTDAGARFLERGRRLLADLAEAEESARRERAKPSGTLVVGAPVMFGGMHVSGALASYLERWPEMAGELRLSDQVVSLVEEGLDVAVRIGPLADSSLVARRVGVTRRVLVAVPRYLRKMPRLTRPEDLRAHRTIAFTALVPGPDWLFQAGGAEQRVTVRPRYLTNSGEAAIGFAIRGGGITPALGYQVAQAIQDRKLRVVLEAFEPPPLPIHIVYPTSRLLSAKVRTFIELIIGSCRWDFTRLG